MDFHSHDKLNWGSKMGSVVTPGKLAVSYTGQTRHKIICSGTHLIS